MLYDAKTPAEYFKLLEEDWRKERLMEVRQMLYDADPELVEGIEYKMLGYGDGEKNLFNLNAQKNYVGLYVGTIDKVPNGRELLKDLDLGKGCIRIKKSVKIEETGLREFIEGAIKHWRAGGDTDC